MSSTSKALSAADSGSAHWGQRWSNEGPQSVWRIKIPRSTCTEYEFRFFRNIWSFGDTIAIAMWGQVECSPERFMTQGFMQGLCETNQPRLDEQDCSSPTMSSGTPLKASRMIFLAAGEGEDGTRVKLDRWMRGWKLLEGMILRGAFLCYEPRAHMIRVFRTLDGDCKEVAKGLEDRVRKMVPGWTRRMEIAPLQGKSSASIGIFCVSMFMDSMDKGKKTSNFYNLREGGNTNSFGVFALRIDDVNQKNPKITLIPVHVPSQMQQHVNSQLANALVRDGKVFVASPEYFVMTIPTSQYAYVYSFKTGQKLVRLNSAVHHASLHTARNFLSSSLLVWTHLGMMACGCSNSIGSVDLRQKAGEGKTYQKHPWEGLGSMTAGTVLCSQALDDKALAICFAEPDFEDELSVYVWRKEDGYQNTRLLPSTSTKLRRSKLQIARMDFSGEYLIVAVGFYMDKMKDKDPEIMFPEMDEDNNCITVVSLFKWGEKGSPIREVLFKNRGLSRWGKLHGFLPLYYNGPWSPLYYDERDETLVVASPIGTEEGKKKIEEQGDDGNRLKVVQVVRAEKCLKTKVQGAKATFKSTGC